MKKTFAFNKKNMNAKYEYYKHNFRWKQLSHMGRYGKAPREGFLLFEKSGKCKYMMKIVHFETKGDKKIFQNEISSIKKTEAITKIRLHDSFILTKSGYIITTCFPNPIPWEKLPKKVEQLAMNNIISQIMEIHEKARLIHGDIAQKNVLVSKNGQIAFIDFEDAKTTNKVMDFVKEIVDVLEMFSLGNNFKCNNDKTKHICENILKHEQKYNRYHDYLLNAIFEY